MTYNYITLSELDIEKFIKSITNILKGVCLYRTIDNRILDFKEGTEKQIYYKKIKGMI